MQYINIFSILASIIIIVSSCCLGTRECPPDSATAQLRIISASNGNDLLFGPNRVYDKSKIVFFSFKGSDTTFYRFESIENKQVGYDSVIQVSFYPLNETAYVRLSNGDVDTLQLTYRTQKKTSCCSGFSELTTINYNNTTTLNVANGPNAINK